MSPLKIVLIDLCLSAVIASVGALLVACGMGALERLRLLSLAALRLKTFSAGSGLKVAGGTSPPPEAWHMIAKRIRITMREGTEDSATRRESRPLRTGYAPSGLKRRQIRTGQWRRNMQLQTVRRRTERASENEKSSSRLHRPEIAGYPNSN
jgi:hypothetical protein